MSHSHPPSISSHGLPGLVVGASVRARDLARTTTRANRGDGSRFCEDSAIAVPIRFAGSTARLDYLRLPQPHGREDFRSAGAGLLHGSIGADLESSGIRSRKKRRRRLDECSKLFADKER